MHFARCLKLIFDYQMKLGVDEMIDRLKLNKLEVDPKLMKESRSFYEKYLNFELPIKLVMDLFREQIKKSFPLSQLILLPAIFYCILFGMEEYGRDTLAALLKLSNVELAKSVLEFTCSELFIDSVQSIWSKAYDEEFVTNELVHPFKRCREDIANYREVFLAELSGAHDRIEPRSTATKPFNLTQPKARAIPVPEPILSKRLLHKVPASTHSEPIEFRLLEEAKKRNRDSVEKLRLRSEREQPDCARSKPKYLKNDQLCEDTEPFVERAFQARKVPDQRSEPAQVHLNTATILREWKLYADAEKSLRKRLAELEAGALDNFRYEQWKSEQNNAKSREQQLSEAERRLTSMLSHEAALEAIYKTQAVRRSMVELARKESKRCSEKILQMQEEKRIKARQQAQRVIQSRHLAHEATVSVYQKKKTSAKNLVEKSQKQLEKLKTELAKEKAEKRALVKRIRAAESAWLLEKSMGPKPVDLCSTPGHGLLGEMSVVELKERLAWLKQREEAAERDKRKFIIAKRQEAVESVAQLLECISHHRAARTLNLIEKRNGSGEFKSSQSDEVTNDPKVVALRKLIEEKRINRKNAMNKIEKSDNRHALDRNDMSEIRKG
ncbi:unnamed protein product [Dicrocoelium dendriticum]|nr:unnamed protein product [Dicrocoelium dendriticum]